MKGSPSRSTNVWPIASCPGRTRHGPGEARGHEVHSPTTARPGAARAATYGKIDVLWYDVASPLDAKGWNKLQGDFSTPEQRIQAEQGDRAWGTRSLSTFVTGRATRSSSPDCATRCLAR